MARVWRCGRFELSLERPLVMGILNVTPDSFSDGGRFFDVGSPEHDAAVAEGRSMIASGADIVDVGGESTRPGADAVDPTDELSRVLPSIRALASETAVSIDTRRVEVARECVGAGAVIINDVSGFRDAAMVELAASCDVGCVVMHMLGEPGTMQDDPRYGDVVAEVGEYLHAQADVLRLAGVAPERIAIDPGIGFGKTVEHNLELLRRLAEIASGDYPVLVGVSRKRFIAAVLGVERFEDRLEGSIAAAAWAAANGADIVRVHDVAETARALRVTTAIARGLRGPGDGDGA